MGMQVRDLPAVDAGLVPTQFVSGIRPPRSDGGVWIVEVYEERCGEALIVARFVMTAEAFQRSVQTALAPVATALGVFLPQVGLNA